MADYVRLSTHNVDLKVASIKTDELYLASSMIGPIQKPTFTMAFICPQCPQHHLKMSLASISASMTSGSFGRKFLIVKSMAFCLDIVLYLMKHPMWSLAKVLNFQE